MIRNCDTCYHRKTDRCPNSSECYETENKPYYEPTLETIEKLTPNDLIEMLNPELIKLNKQYEIEKQQLISFLKKNIKEIDNEIKIKQLTQQGNPGLLQEIHELRIISLIYQEVLDFTEKGGKE